MRNIVIYTLGLFLSLSLISCSQKEEAKRVPLAPKKVKADTILLEDVVFPVYSSFSGVVEPKVRVSLSAKIPAFVKAVGAEEGDFVEKGDLLVRLDDTEIRSKINGLVEQKKALQKDKAALESDYSYAKANYDRFQRLFNEEAATKDEFDRAKADYLAVKNRLSAFDARIKAVDEEIKALTNELRYLVIKSPVSGWVTKRSVDPGSFVGPGAHLFDIDSKEEGFWFVASLNESLLNKVSVGDEVFLSIEQAAGLKVLKISRVIPKVDVNTHTFKVKLDLPGDNLKSGMYGKIWIRTGEKKGLILPLEAVVKRGGIKGVYVVDKNGQIHWRVVTVGKLYLRGPKGLFPWSEELEPSGSQFEQVALISSGIVPGAKIIVSNLFEVREGMSLE